MKNISMLLCVSLLFTVRPLSAAETGGQAVRTVTDSLRREGLRNARAFELLQSLIAVAPHRLSGSSGASAAVAFMKRAMEQYGFDRVHLEHVMVPHWIRGSVEEAEIVRSRIVGNRRLHACALGGSVGTPPGGISGGIVEVHSFRELAALGTRTRGKIVFFNRPFDQTLINTFAGYSGAVDQRVQGAIEAARVGAIGVLVRSVTPVPDTIPHTGTMRYEEGVPRIPSVAISTVDADLLSRVIADDPGTVVRIALECQTGADVPSANVVGELTGTEFPDQVIVVGGHLDAWDKGNGAHDDGAGCVQAVEALRLLRQIGFRPKRTIRAVLFMNEENGGRGGEAYAASSLRDNEKQLFALESDRGGFAPRGFSIQADSTVVRSIAKWSWLLETVGAGRITEGGSGSDVEPLASAGVPAAGLLPDDSRYFDYHHSDNDTIDKVNPRELELGAIAEAVLCILVSEGAIPSVLVP